MSEIDIVVPLGKGSKFKNAELRYFLRSVEKFCTGYRKIFIIGHDPGFLNPEFVRFVPCPCFNTNKETRIALKFFRLFDTVQDVTDEVLMANDDFLFVAPTDIRKIPDYQRGKLLNAAKPQQVRGMKEPQQTRYQKILVRTHEALTEAGLPAFHYDLHVPIRFKKKVFLGLRKWWEKSRNTKDGFTMKSIYGNHIHPNTPGPIMADCKFGAFKDEAKFQKQIKGRWVISYGDPALSSGLMHSIHARFPNISKFEKK